MLTAAFMVGAIALLAFALDLGYIQVIGTEMQRTADSAAMASAWSLLENSGLGGGDATLAASQAVAGASQFVNLNKVGGASLALGSGDTTVGYLCNPSDSTAAIDTTADPNRFNAIRVRVRKVAAQNGEVPLFFARLLGTSSIAEQAEATAAFLNNFSGFSVPSSDVNLQILPFALDQQTWNALLHGQGYDYWTWDAANNAIAVGHDGIPEANLFPQGTDSPGNRGTVDIGSSNNSTADIRRQITEGVSANDLAFIGGKLQLNESGVLTLNGDTGISAGVESALLSIKGKPRIIPIFNAVSGPGNNAQYTIVGFGGIRIMDVNLNGSLSSKRVIIQLARVTATGGIPGGTTQTSQYLFSPIWLVR